MAPIIRRFSLYAFALIPLLNVCFVSCDKPNEERKNAPTAVEVKIPVSINPYLQGLPEKQKKQAEVIFMPGKSLEEKQEAVRQLAASDKASVLPAVFALAKGDGGADLKPIAREELIHILEDGQLSLAGKIIAKALVQYIPINATITDPMTTPQASMMIGVLEEGAPLEKKKTDLLLLADMDLVVARKIAIALAYTYSDKNKPFFLNLFNQISGKVNKLSIGDKENILKVMLVDDDLFSEFEYLLRDGSKLSDADILELFPIAANDRAELAFIYAAEIKRRNLVSKYHNIFIDTLLSAEVNGATRNVLYTLAKNSQNQFDANDIAVFANWESLLATKPLFAICLLSNDDELGSQAFSAIAARSSHTNLIVDLINWTKANHWEDRSKLYWPISVIALSDIVSDTEVDKALDRLMLFASSPRLLPIILSSNDGKLIAKVIDRVAAITDSGQLLKLLQHPAKEVRISAIKGLEGRNDLLTLHGLTKAYEGEKDPEVLAVYQQSTHWVIQQRETPN